MYSLLIAAKSDFLSEHIKSGSFIYVYPLNVKRELNAKEEKDINSASLYGEEIFSVTAYKPFCCEICHKGFTRKPHLKIHQHVHTGDKPYVCDGCHKGFSQKSHLKTNQRIHTGDRPYVCDICNKGFSQKGHLKQHQRVHT